MMGNMITFGLTTNGQTNGSDLIGPFPTKVRGAKFFSVNDFATTQPVGFFLFFLFFFVCLFGI